MSEEICAYCSDPLDENALRHGDKAYCCEACAFEASRSTDCGGRTDAPFSNTTTEAVEHKSQDS